ncbi:hypothetical protein ABKN59_005013 [Abortiporus biennis]
MVDDNDSPRLPFQGSVEETTAMLPSVLALSPLQPLIFDVLVQIMGLLDSRPDVLSFMKTSKAFYQAGFPCLLRLPISLYLWQRSNNGHLESFLAYLQKYPSRLQYIENFSAMMGGLGYQMIAQYYSNLFVAIMGVIKLVVRNAGSLRKLSFNGFGRHVDQEHSSVYPVSVVEVYPAQFTLNHLRDLFITRIGIDEIIMLKGLTAPITSLMLIYADIFKATPDPHESELNPFLLLTNFQSTIEKLELTGCRWPGPNQQASPAHQGSSSFFSPPSYGICCPRLHTLTTSYETTPNTSSFVLTFPNLKRLTVLDDKEIFEGDYSGRETNTENQRALLRQGFGWDVLEKVTGHPKLLNALALQTKIHHLRVEYCYAQDLVLLHRLIQDTKPDILTLVLVDFQSTDPFRLDTHPRNLRIASPPYQLESLLLDVVEENDSLTSEEASEIAERTIRILGGRITRARCSNFRIDANFNFSSLRPYIVL